MSRIARMPIAIPSGVNVVINGQTITIKGKNGEITRTFNKAVDIRNKNNILTFSPRKGYTDGWIQAGTVRASLSWMIIGVTKSFVKKLQLIGVGYRASVQDNIVSLSLGFSHFVEHQLPACITAECPSQNEIILKSTDKQLVCQVAADIRSYRPPEPYKGKGIRYFNEIIRFKEAKK